MMARTGWTYVPCADGTEVTVWDAPALLQREIHYTVVPESVLVGSY
jgi:hypothetical protein